MCEYISILTTSFLSFFLIIGSPVSCEHTPNDNHRLHIAYNQFHDIARRIPRRIELDTLLELDKYCNEKQLSFIDLDVNDFTQSFLLHV